MSGRDIVVTIPKDAWRFWCNEGDLPDSAWSGAYSHFTVSYLPKDVAPGIRVYVASYGRLRGYAPLVTVEQPCQLGRRACLVRAGGAVALTIPEPMPVFRGWRYVWWARSQEVPFPEWRTEGVRWNAILPQAPAGAARPAGHSHHPGRDRAPAAPHGDHDAAGHGVFQ